MTNIKLTTYKDNRRHEFLIYKNSRYLHPRATGSGLSLIFFVQSIKSLFNHCDKKYNFKQIITIIIIAYSRSFFSEIRSTWKVQWTKNCHTIRENEKEGAKEVSSITRAFIYSNRLQVENNSTSNTTIMKHTLCIHITHYPCSCCNDRELTRQVSTLALSLSLSLFIYMDIYDSL